jgi:hypothetical protein
MATNDKTTYGDWKELVVQDSKELLAEPHPPKLSYRSPEPSRYIPRGYVPKSARPTAATKPPQGVVFEQGYMPSPNTVMLSSSVGFFVEEDKDWEEAWSEGPPDAKKNKMKKQNMHWEAAIVDLRKAAIPTDPSKFQGHDGEMFKLGVRVGQSWDVPLDEDTVTVAPVGYTKVGFVWVSCHKTTDGAYPLYKLYNLTNPRWSRRLVDRIFNREGVLNSCVTARFVDDQGMPKPGLEIDVLLAGINQVPAYWFDSHQGRGFHLTVCKNGHYLFSERPLSIGTACGPMCQESKHSKAADSFFRRISRIISRKQRKTDACSATTAPALSAVFVPFTKLDMSLCIGRRILDSITTPKFKHRTWAPMQASSTSSFYQETEKLLKAGVRSGQVYSLQTNAGFGFAKIHKRACQYIHLECSPDPVFDGKTDTEFLKVALQGNLINLHISKKQALTLYGVSLRACPICEDQNPVFFLAPHPGNGIPKTITPLTLHALRQTADPNMGDIVVAKKQLAVVERFSQTSFGAVSIMLSTSKGKRFSMSPQKVRLARNVPAEVLDQFFDDDHFLKVKKASISRWHKRITRGSKLKARQSLTGRKASLAGQEVTACGAAFQVKNTWYITVLESNELINLDTDVLPRKTFPLEKGTILEDEVGQMVITEINKGIATLNDGEVTNTWPEAGLHFALNENRMRIVPQYTPAHLAK